MSASVASGTNTFVPSFDATAKLVVDFSRNPSKFPLNKYTTLTPVKKSLGYYLRMTVEESARILQSDLANFVWPDGQDAPTNEWGNESFNFVPYATKRYQYGFRIGYKAEEQADWKILASYARIHAQQAMVARTQAVATVLFTTANYGANNDTATNLGGGLLSSADVATPYIQKTFREVISRLVKATNNGVDKSDFIAVMNPDVAKALAATGEIQNALKNSPFALAQVRGDVESQNGVWGLPDTYAGVKLMVEDTVKVTSRKGATRAASYIFKDTTTNGQIIFLARPSQISVEGGGPSFGSVHVLSYEEMTVEQRDDPDNRRILGRVVEDFDVQLVAPAASFYVDHVLA